MKKLNAAVGQKVYFNVLAINNGELVTGKPYVENCAVEAEVLGQGKGDKVVIFKDKAKKDSQKRRTATDSLTQRLKLLLSELSLQRLL